MDNVTHSIAGLLLAQGVIAWRSRGAALPSGAFARAAAWISVIGNNLPDIDFVYLWITPGKTGYLLHHRGHTHTLVGGLIGALLIGAITWLATRKRQQEPRDVRWLAGLALAGPVVHMGMDFLNNYGVHPFWPLDSRWFYGDSVFIIEPWLWVVAVPPLVLLTESLLLRGLLAFVLVAGLGLAWAVDIVPWGVAVALTLASGMSVWVTTRLRAPGKALYGAVGFASVVIFFAVCSRVAFARVNAEPLGPGATRLDATITPDPGNPLCFSTLSVERDGPAYRLRIGTVAAFPSVLPAESCGVESWEPNVPLRRLAPGNSRGVRWTSEWSAPLEELVALNRTNCHVRALLKFMRVPYWVQLDRTTLQLGDLRYDRSKQEDFAEVRVPLEPKDCPPNVPGWTPPRQDLLE